MPYRQKEQSSSILAVLLFIFSLVNSGLMYLASILLARNLPIGDFDDYSVAVSMITMLSTIATLGLEKYALRGIALFRERKDWQKFRGYIGFSVKIIIFFSTFLVACFVLGLESVLAFKSADYHIAIPILTGFLPVIALVLFYVEVVAAVGKFLLSFTIYRLILPMAYLCILFVLMHTSVAFTAVSAAIGYGLAWLFTLFIFQGIIFYQLPYAIKSAEPIVLKGKWLRRSVPLVMNSLLMTAMTSGGVILLELMHPSELEVGIFAAAMHTGAFISLIGTSTNRFYLPRMVVLIEQNNKKHITALISERTFIVGSVILLLFSGFVVFGSTLLTLFGTQFSSGYLALVFIAGGACFSALFADIPYVLQYLGHHRLVLVLTTLAVLMMIILSYRWGGVYGATGVALAYMLPVMVLFTSFRCLMGLYVLKR
jgi:O-antigen/teichoic acid export membrane protein